MDQLNHFKLRLRLCFLQVLLNSSLFWIQMRFDGLDIIFGKFLDIYVASYDEKFPKSHLSGSLMNFFLRKMCLLIGWKFSPLI